MAFSALSLFLAPTKTCHPFKARCLLIPNPMPLLAPVIRTLFMFILYFSFFFFKIFSEDNCCTFNLSHARTLLVVLCCAFRCLVVGMSNIFLIEFQQVSTYNRAV